MIPAYIFTDAHKTGLGTILCQGKPVAIAS